MNEQIEKLAKKAGMVMYPTGLGISENTLWGDHNISKLAESIVGECVSICEEHPAWTGRMIGEQIKQHFGVEEPKSWHCPKCGIDRTKAVCPKGHTAAITGDCPMTAEAQ